MQHHAFVIEAEAEEGIGAAQAWVRKELGMDADSNPDVVVLRYGLFSVADARRVSELAAGAPFAGDKKAVVIAAARAYHESQNALLKLFEEPPAETYLFFILPSLGALLPTLRSRVQILAPKVGHRMSDFGAALAGEFLRASREKRSALIKKLASGKDDEERRKFRDDAIGIVNGVERAAYGALKEDARSRGALAALLTDIATLRSYLYDRSAPVRMILEHLSLVIPKGLL